MLKKDLSYYEYELESEHFGIYRNYYNFENSDLYKERLDEIKRKQKEMISGKVATNYLLSYIVDGSKKRVYFR